MSRIRLEEKKNVVDDKEGTFKLESALSGFICWVLWLQQPKKKKKKKLNF